MADDKDRILMAIAVSSPDGKLDALPGAVTAAKRMAAWAEAHEYHTICVTDEGGREVTVDLLRAELAAAIEHVTNRTHLKRLIVYFAGHGAAQAVGDQYWMLSRWDRRPTEAIKVAALQRMLAYYGPAQVTIIGDACQEYSARFLDVIGSAVLDKPPEEPRGYELDQFFAVDVGKQAFMVKAANGTDAFCLFTEVLLNALEGDAPLAWERVGAEQAVTSQTLAAHLMRSVATEAGKHGVRMVPRPLPGFFTDRTYVTMPAHSPVTTINPSATGRAEREAPATEPGADRPEERDTGKRTEMEARRRAFETEVRAADVRKSFETGAGICVSGTFVKQVFASHAETEEIEEHAGWFRFNLDRGNARGWSDALIAVKDGRLCHACVVQGYVAALHLLADHRSISLFHRPLGNNEDVVALMISMQAQLHAGTATTEAIVDMATMVHGDGHRLFTMGCLAAQYYDAVRDVYSLRQLASHFAMGAQPVPLDIALYGGAVIFESDGLLFARIPAVPEHKARVHTANAQPFSTHESPAFDMYPIAGRIPWMREAWSAVATAECDASAEHWRADALRAMQYLRPGAFTNFAPAGRTAAFALAGGWLRPETTSSLTH